LVPTAHEYGLSSNFFVRAEFKAVELGHERKKWHPHRPRDRIRNHRDASSTIRFYLRRGGTTKRNSVKRER